MATFYFAITEGVASITIGSRLNAQGGYPRVISTKNAWIECPGFVNGAPNDCYITDVLFDNGYVSCRITETDSNGTPISPYAVAKYDFVNADPYYVSSESGAPRYFIIDAKPYREIVFNGNGGLVNNVTLELLAFAYSDTIIYPAEHTATKAGVDFTGWYTDPISGVRVSAPFQPTYSRRLYAHWSTTPTLKVKLDANGGYLYGLTSVTIPYDSGDIFDASIYTPAKGGYVFDGWYSERVDGYRINAPFVVLESRTLYAHWHIAAPITTHFNANGGLYYNGDTDRPLTKSYGEVIALIDFSESVYRLNHHILGWDPSPSAESPMYPSNGGYTVMEEATLFAIWAVDTHTITMYRNDGTSTTITGLVEHGHKYDFPNMTRIGYIFVGWNTNSSGTGTFYTDDSVISEDLTVYAIWRVAPTCTVTYSAEYAGSGYDTPDNPDDSTAYDYGEDGEVFDIVPDIPVIRGLEFVGWVQTTSRPLTQQTVYHPTKSVVELSDGTEVQAQNTIFVGSGKTVRLWAVYNVLYFEFIPNPNTTAAVENMPTAIKCATFSSAATLLVVGGPPTRDLFIFAGWCLYPDSTNHTVYFPGDTIGTMTGQSLPIYAVWKPVPLDVMFYWCYPESPTDLDDSLIFVPGKKITLTHLPNGTTENESVFRAEFWNYFVKRLTEFNSLVNQQGVIQTGYIVPPVYDVSRGDPITADMINPVITYLNHLAGLLGLQSLATVTVGQAITAQFFLDIKYKFNEIIVTYNYGGEFIT